MRISNLRIHHAPDMVLGDLDFDTGSGLHRQLSRIDRLADALIDCIDQLDHGGVHTFRDPKSEAYVRAERVGADVAVQSEGTAFLPDGVAEQDYRGFRADVMSSLHEYCDSLVEAVPQHPETNRFLSRLKAIETA
jgi:hypothetical protein